MTWANTWNDILNGGNGRWKVNDLGVKEKALAHILEHSGPVDRPLRILCPLAGDDQFVQHAWSKGHDVTAIDIVPGALEAMRGQFGDAEDWSSEKNGSDVVWKHKSGRATTIEGDMLMKRPELADSFDAVYDKDSFGALSPDMRSPFCDRLAEFTRDGAVVYTEVKNKGSGREFGPPYHIEKDDLMEASNYGSNFEHVSSLGEVYPLGGPMMKQMGHVIRRMPRL
jgi:hypothetical protein